MSVLPAFEHTYKQAPFEDCDEETYERLMKTLTSIDLNYVHEVDDNTDLSGEVACGAGGCTVV